MIFINMIKLYHKWMTINKFAVLGERCGGTNFLQQAIGQNFGLEITCEYGLKHYFGFNEFKNSDNVLFIGIVREPYKWLNSFCRSPHQVAPELKGDRNKFITNGFLV